MAPAQQYAGDKLAETDIAVLQGYVAKPFADKYHTTIGHTKMETTGPGEHKKFGLPGDDEVQVYCFKALTSYRPSTTLLLRAGQPCLLKCKVPDGEALITVNAQRMG